MPWSRHPSWLWPGRAWVTSATALALPGSQLDDSLNIAGYALPGTTANVPFRKVNLGLEALFTPKGFFASAGPAQTWLVNCHEKFIATLRMVRKNAESWSDQRGGAMTLELWTIEIEPAQLGDCLQASLACAPGGAAQVVEVEWWNRTAVMLDFTKGLAELQQSPADSPAWQCLWPAA